MQKPNLSIILPAFNEEENIAKALDSAIEFAKNNLGKYELLVINDGSIDDTQKIVERYIKENKNVKLINHEKNKGYGGAELTGFRNAKFDLVTLVPTDNQFDINELNKYFSLIENADIVMGYRRKRKDPLLRIINSKLYGFLIFVLFRMTWFGDLDWVKMYKKEVLDSINIVSITPFVDAEVIIRAYKNGCTIKEIKVTHFSRKYGKSAGVNFKIIFNTIKEVFGFWFKYKNGKL